MFVHLVLDGFENREAATSGWPAIRVDVECDVDVSFVEDVGSAVHARSDAVVGVPGHHHLRAGAPQIGYKELGHSEVEPRLGVAAIGLGPRRVTGFLLATVPYLVVDVRRVGVVAPIVTGVDPDHATGEQCVCVRCLQSRFPGRRACAAVARGLSAPPTLPRKR